MLHEQIAIALGITRGALQDQFRDDLSSGAYRRRLEVMVALYRAAVGGNVTAMRAYLAREPALAAPPAPPAPAPALLGKKAQAAADAKTAQEGTGWEDLLPPGTKLQ